MHATANPIVDPQKMMLGPCRGGAGPRAVRLADLRVAPRGVRMIGEGIEIDMQASANPSWAALSTSGLCDLDMTKDVPDMIVGADGDEVGEAGVRDCALRWRRKDRRVRIAGPPMWMVVNDIVSHLHFKKAI